MNGLRTLALASVPAAGGLAWHRYRRAVRELEIQPAVAPDLPGVRREIVTSWGSVAYRWIEGDHSRSPLVLIHGWGKTADSAWWPVITDCGRTMVVVDLPGHGQSQLDEPFTFELAAEAVEQVISDTRVNRPALVGHSLGGPVAFTAIRRAGADTYSGLVAAATSAYWVRPGLRAMIALAPYAMGPGSPLLLHAERSDRRDDPDRAHHIAWAYTRRPVRRLLDETATALRTFDARSWADLSLPPTTWVVATEDSVLAPRHQYASARHFGAPVVEVEAQHSLVLQAPAEMLDILEQFSGQARSA